MTMITPTIMITSTIMTITTGTRPIVMARSKAETSRSPSAARRPPAASTDAAATSSAIDHAALYRLMTWLSPAFPVGAFSYSSGIEWAVEAGDIADAKTLTHWLAAMLTQGAGLNDAIFLAQTWRACADRDAQRLRDVAELAAAFVTSRERLLETTAQGRAFVEIARAAWPCETLELLRAVEPDPVAYPVAVAALGAGHGVPLELTLHAFLHAQTSNWISAGVRLIPLGQTDSQRVLAALEPQVHATADRAKTATLDDLGSATFRADLAGMRHEAQYTRLFRS
jgi:urease accessory protein